MIDVSKTEAYGGFQSLTVRAAIARIIFPLSPGDHTVISDVRSLRGTIIPKHTIQVVIKQIAPKDWTITTQTLIGNEVIVRRIK